CADDSITTRHYLQFQVDKLLINLNLFHSFKCTSINKKFTLTVLRNTFSSKIQKLSSYMIMIESRRVYLTSVKLIFRQGCASLLPKLSVHKLFYLFITDNFFREFNLNYIIHRNLKK